MKIIILASILAVSALAQLAELNVNLPLTFRPGWKRRQLRNPERSPNMVTFRSTSTVGSNTTFQEFRIAAAGKSDLRLLSIYGTTTSTTSEGTTVNDQTLSRLRARFMAIVEYRDFNNDGVFRASDDQIISVYRIGKDSATGASASWNFGAVNPASTTSGAGAYVTSVSTSDNVFILTAQVAGDGYVLPDGTVVPPTQIKFSITINYHFQSTNTRLALVMRLESVQTGVQTTQSASVSSSTYTKQISFGSSASFAWSDTAQATLQDNTNTTVTVTASPLVFFTSSTSATVDPVGGDDSQGEIDSHTEISGSSPTIAVFNFNANQPRQIYWDPTMGSDARVDSGNDNFTSTPPVFINTSSSMAPAALMALIFAALAALFI